MIQQRTVFASSIRLCGLLLVLLGFVPVAAQTQRVPTISPDRFSPDAFFQELFGEESAADRAALQKVPISLHDEKRFGDAAAKQYLTQLKQRGVDVTDKGKDADYVRCLVNSVRSQMKNRKRYANIKVYIADSSDTEAISFPGGTTVIHRGLIDFCENEAALVGVIGHELSHIDRGHQLYCMRRFKAAQQSFRSGNFDPRKMMNMGSMMAKTFSRPFRPEEETEADLDGATWAYALGYDAKQMAEVFLRLHNRDRGKPNPPTFFQSHPFHIDRYKAILERANSLETKRPKATLYIGAENLSERNCLRRKRSSK